MRQQVLTLGRDQHAEQDGGIMYTSDFLVEVLTGGGAWRREARVVVALAARQHVALDEQLLILSDIHDLQALSHSLQEREPWTHHAEDAALGR